MTLANLKVIAVPGDGAFHNLAIHARVVTELVTLRPFFNIEEVAEELEGIGFAKQTQAKRAAKMTLEDRCRFL